MVFTKTTGDPRYANRPLLHQWKIVSVTRRQLPSTLWNVFQTNDDSETERASNLRVPSGRMIWDACVALRSTWR